MISLRSSSPPTPLLAATMGAFAADPAASGDPASFSTLLEKSHQHLATQADRRTQAENAAAGLVANALILPILKQLRRSTFGESTVFSGGNGERAFGPQFDMHLADRIAQSPNLGIKNVLADRLMKKAPAEHKGLDLHG